MLTAGEEADLLRKNAMLVGPSVAKRSANARPSTSHGNTSSSSTTSSGTKASTSTSSSGSASTYSGTKASTSNSSSSSASSSSSGPKATTSNRSLQLTLPQVFSSSRPRPQPQYLGLANTFGNNNNRVGQLSPQSKPQLTPSTPYNRFRTTIFSKSEGKYGLVLSKGHVLLTWLISLLLVKLQISKPRQHMLHWCYSTRVNKPPNIC